MKEAKKKKNDYQLHYQFVASKYTCRLLNVWNISRSCLVHFFRLSSPELHVISKRPLQATILVYEKITIFIQRREKAAIFLNACAHHM